MPDDTYERLAWKEYFDLPREEEDRANSTISFRATAAKYDGISGSYEKLLSLTRKPLENVA
ncbi:MAG: hypothetical protein M3R51_06795 [Candidatus Eremiobacteraeota bacterium]|nr:hypothetical protein [Candidatus Eremiobacteraeota bacterium]